MTRRKHLFRTPATSYLCKARTGDVLRRALGCFLRCVLLFSGDASGVAFGTPADPKNHWIWSSPGISLRQAATKHLPDRLSLFEWSLYVFFFLTESTWSVRTFPTTVYECVRNVTFMLCVYIYIYTLVLQSISEKVSGKSSSEDGFGRKVL